MVISYNVINANRNDRPAFAAWLVVGLLFFVGALNYLDRIMITTMRESITESIPMTDAQFGLLTSIFLWVYGFLSPFVGYLADRFNRSRMIIISIFVWSGVTWLTAYVTNGCAGYVPPAHEFELGGYETWRCRSSKLDIYSECSLPCFCNLPSF